MPRPSWISTWFCWQMKGRMESWASIPQETPDNGAWESHSSGLCYISPTHNWLHQRHGTKWSSFWKWVRKSADPSEQVLLCYKWIIIDTMVIIIIISSPRIERIDFADSKVSSRGWQPWTRSSWCGEGSTAPSLVISSSKDTLGFSE